MSLGSGSFLDVNTGQDVHASIRGLVPLVGWKMGSELVYFAEGKMISRFFFCLFIYVFFQKKIFILFSRSIS